MTDADQPAAGDDPFERAMAREQAYRHRRSRAGSGMNPGEVAILRLFGLVGLGSVLAWGGLLAVHWRFLGEPRWLAILHTIVYGLVWICIAAVGVTFMVMRKKPEVYNPDDPE